MVRFNKASMMNSNYNIIKTKYFIFFVDNRIDKKQTDSLIEAIDNRYNKMSSYLFEIDSCDKKNKYIKYTINWSTDGKISGKSFVDNIVCNINEKSLYTEMPMVHEEAHLVVYKKWGVLPLFWAEGLSEYLVLKYKNKLQTYLSRPIINNILNLDEKKVIDLLCYYSDEMFNYWRRNGKIYALSACSLFDYIIANYGVELLNYYVSFLQQGKHNEFEIIIKESKIFDAWKEYVCFTRNN